jgi:hypothetical protein
LIGPPHDGTDAIHLQPGAASGVAARKAGALAGRRDLPAGTFLPGSSICRGRKGRRHPDHQQHREGTDRHQYLAHRHHSRMNEAHDAELITAGCAGYQRAGAQLM